MRFRYSLLEPATNERESLPRAPMFLFNGVNSLETLGLLDTGAMTNILPYELGLKLGGVWDERSAYLRIGGGLYPQPAMSFFTMAKVADLPSVKLAFAWVRNPNIPLILGQFNFFINFDVCFYRSQNEFEVKPKAANA